MEGPRCVIPSCLNGTTRLVRWMQQFCQQHQVKKGVGHCSCEPPFSLISFPENVAVRDRWTKLVNRKKLPSGKNWMPTENSKVCSEHFVDGEPTPEYPDPTENLGYILNVTSSQHVAKSPVSVSGVKNQDKVKAESTVPTQGTSSSCAIPTCHNGTNRLTRWMLQFCQQHQAKKGVGHCSCEPPFSLFSFPDNVAARNRWTKLVNRKNLQTGEEWTPTENSRVCSKHFVDGEPTSEYPDPTEELGYIVNHQFADVVTESIVPGYDIKNLGKVKQETESDSDSDCDKDLLNSTSYFKEDFQNYDVKLKEEHMDDSSESEEEPGEYAVKLEEEHMGDPSESEDGFSYAACHPKEEPEEYAVEIKEEHMEDPSEFEEEAKVAKDFKSNCGFKQVLGSIKDLKEENFLKMEWVDIEYEDEIEDITSDEEENNVVAEFVDSTESQEWAAQPEHAFVAFLQVKRNKNRVEFFRIEDCCYFENQYICNKGGNSEVRAEILFGPYKGRISEKLATLFVASEVYVICLVWKDKPPVIYFHTEGNEWVDWLKGYEMGEIKMKNKNISMTLLELEVPKDFIQDKTPSQAVEALLLVGRPPPPPSPIHRIEKQTPNKLQTVASKRYVCSACDGHFNSQKHLNLHKCHHPPVLKSESIQTEKKKIWKSTAEARARRQATRVYKRNHQCKECQKWFLYPSCLEKHQRVHTKERTFECEICKKMYKTPTDLQFHMRLHTKERNQECPECGHRFLGRAQLEEHRLIHTGEKPHQCHLCGKGFRVRSSLTLHIEQTHYKTVRFNCEICEKGYYRKGELKSHVDRVHLGIKNYVCHACDWKFSNPGNLKKHNKIHHAKEKRAVSTKLKKYSKAHKEEDDAAVQQ